MASNGNYIGANGNGSESGNGDGNGKDTMAANGNGVIINAATADGSGNVTNATRMNVVTAGTGGDGATAASNSNTSERAVVAARRVEHFVQSEAALQLQHYKELAAAAEEKLQVAMAAKAEGDAAIQTVKTIAERFECLVCYQYVPVVGYGVECLQGHATCIKCSQPRIVYGAKEDGSQDHTIDYLQCGYCQREVGPPLQHAFYDRLASELIFDCRESMGGCGYVRKHRYMLLYITCI